MLIQTKVMVAAVKTLLWAFILGLLGVYGWPSLPTSWQHLRQRIRGSANTCRMDIGRSDSRFVDPNEKRAASAVVLTVFAGRERFLTLLAPFALHALEREVIDQLHLWWFCRSGLRSPDDGSINDPAFVTALATAKGARLFDGGGPGNWGTYYAFYAQWLRADDVLIKCDDDVVHLSGLEHLVSLARRGSSFMYLPHVINNDVSARVQLELGVDAFRDAMRASTSSASSPRGGGGGGRSGSSCSAWHQLQNCTASAEPCSLWSVQPGCADAAHRAARSAGVAALRRKELYVWDEPRRVSINMYAMRGEHARRAFAQLALRCYAECDDEPFLTFHFLAQTWARARTRWPREEAPPPTALGRRHSANSSTSANYAMCLNTVAVHYSFGPQQNAKGGVNPAHLAFYAREAAKVFRRLSPESRNVLTTRYHAVREVLGGQ